MDKKITNIVAIVFASACWFSAAFFDCEGKKRLSAYKYVRQVSKGFIPSLQGTKQFVDGRLKLLINSKQHLLSGTDFFVPRSDGALLRQIAIGGWVVTEISKEMLGIPAHGVNEGERDKTPFIYYISCE